MNKKWLILGGMLMTVFLTGCEEYVRSKENLEQLARNKIYLTTIILGKRIGKTWITFENVDTDIKDLEVECEDDSCRIEAKVFVKENHKTVADFYIPGCWINISQEELKHAVNNPARTVDDPYNMSRFHRPIPYYLAFNPNVYDKGYFSPLPVRCFVPRSAKK